MVYIFDMWQQTVFIRRILIGCWWNICLCMQIWPLTWPFMDVWVVSTCKWSQTMETARIRVAQFHLNIIQYCNVDDANHGTWASYIFLTVIHYADLITSQTSVFFQYLECGARALKIYKICDITRIGEIPYYNGFKLQRGYFPL